MGKISLLVGNTAKNTENVQKVAACLSSFGYETSFYHFASENYASEMNTLLHASSDWIIACGLDVLSVTMTGGDYYINKFTEPVLILLDEPLNEQISLLNKRMNVTILFYSTIKADVEAVRALPQPLFCGYVENYHDMKALLERAQKDLYEDV